MVADEMTEIPLHIKEVPTIDWRQCDELVGKQMPEWAQAWDKLTEAFRDGDKIDQRLKEAGLSPTPRFVKSRICAKDAFALLRAKRFNRVERRRVLQFARLFTVLELEKNRRRWILHPRTLNALARTMGPYNVPFPTVDQLRQRCKKNQYAVCIDFAAFYQHFPMDEKAALYFGVATSRGETLIPTTIPTGASEPPLFAQILTMAMVREAVSRVGAVIDTDCFIDNIRLSGNCPTSLKLALDSLYEVASQFRVRINEDIEAAWNTCLDQRPYVFLGIVFDHTNKTVALSEKSKQKLRTWKQCLSGEAPFTVVDWQSVFGLCVWCSLTISHPRADYYYVYKFMRRKLGLLAKGHITEWDDVSVWPSIRPIWDRWLENLLTAQPYDLLLPSVPTFCVYTDASLHGFGAVFFGAHERQEAIVGEAWQAVVAEQWSLSEKQKHINLLEIRAVRRALEKWNMPVGAAIVRLFIDNTSAMYQLQKGSSTSFEHNEEIRKIQLICKDRNITLESVSYVRSEDNHADWWSRIYVPRKF